MLESADAREERVKKFNSELWDLLENKTVIFLCSRNFLDGQIVVPWYMKGEGYPEIIERLDLSQCVFKLTCKDRWRGIWSMSPELLASFARMLFELGLVYYGFVWFPAG